MTDSMNNDLQTVLHSDYEARLGESPVWADGHVWWVDVDGWAVLRTNAATGHTDRWRTREPAGFVVMTDRGKPAVGLRNSIQLLDPESGLLVPLAVIDDPDVRFNDATVDAMGRLWAGTMDLALAEPRGRLYLIGADLAPRSFNEGYITLNGLACDDRNGWLYISDSHPRVQSVWRFPWTEAGGIAGERQLFRRFDDLDGRPDGAAIDDGGNYWIAGVGGAALHCFSPGGEHLHAIRTEAGAPTKPGFDGGALALTAKGGDSPQGRLTVGFLPGVSGPRQPVWRISGS
jgi:sugar lactone lactonase YvrE